MARKASNICLSTALFKKTAWLNALMCRNFIARVYSRSARQIKLSRALAHNPRRCCGVPAASESGFSSECARRRREAKVHICACARPAHVFIFFKPFREPCVRACVACVRADMLLSVSRSPKLKGETDSQGSGTGGGGRAAHTCSAQIRLICLGLASHCLPSLHSLSLSLSPHWSCQFLRLRSFPAEVGERVSNPTLPTEARRY